MERRKMGKNRKKKLTLFIATVLVFSLLLHEAAIVPADAAVTAETTEEPEIPEGYTPIYTINDLAGINNDTSGKYILMNDIDMTEETAVGGSWDTGHGWTPLDMFSGTFDGNGYRIIGMNIYGNVDTYGNVSGIGSSLGLFAGLQNEAIIQNLGIVECSISVSANSEASSEVYVGGIAGCHYNGVATIHKCYVSGNIKNEGGFGTGGIIGYSAGADITCCYNMAEVTAKSTVGGIVGYIDLSCFVAECYNWGKISSSSDSLYVGAIAGNKYGSSPHPISCYYLYGTAGSGVCNQSDTDSGCTALTSARMEVASSFTGFDFENTWIIDSLSPYTYPQLRACPSMRVESLEIKNLPTDLSFYQGSTLNLPEATVAITYENGTKTETWLKADMISGVDMNTIGTQQAVVTWLDRTTTFEITVKEVEVTDVSISQEAASVAVGGTLQLSASVLPSNASNKSISWSSDNETIATVTSGGVVSGINGGTTKITATAANGLFASCEVFVFIPAKAIRLSESSLKLTPGEEKTLTAALSPLTTTDNVTWTSSRADVAAVSKNGVVSGVSVGTAVITAKTGSGISAVCTVTVHIPATSISLNMSSLTLDKGKTATLISTLAPWDSTDDVTWSSSNPAAVFVSAGIITAKARGTAVITATTASGKNAVCTITVKSPATGISLSQTKLTLNKGKTKKLTASLKPSDSTDGVTWSSSNPAVAAVSQQGIITAKGKGTAKITVKTTSGKKATCIVTVKVPAKSVKLKKANLTLKKGQSKTLTATVKPSNTTDKLLWSSSKKSVATVSQKGVVKAKKAGTTKITVKTTSGKKATCTIKVK